MGLQDGASISDAQIDALEAAAARHAAMARTVRLLERRPRSRREIAHALRRFGLDERTAAGVIGDLQAAGWIDDARFARLWVRDRLALKPSGRRRLRFELLARGVGASVIEEVLTELLPRDHERDVALTQARCRAARLERLPRDVAIRRLTVWLQRRGFSNEVVASVMHALWRQGAVDADV